ncbi:hypothetical protein ACFL6A_00950 [bacterium]
MSEHVKWIDYKSISILFCNYNGLTGEEYTKAIEEQEKQVLDSGKERVYVLLDVTNSHMSQESTQRAKDLEENIKTKGITQVMALVGFSGIQRVIGRAIKRDIHFSKDLEDAKEWLLSQKDI